jgi:hypothetical protein
VTDAELKKFFAVGRYSASVDDSFSTILNFAVFLKLLTLKAVVKVSSYAYYLRSCTCYNKCLIFGISTEICHLLFFQYQLLTSVNFADANHYLVLIVAHARCSLNLHLCIKTLTLFLEHRNIPFEQGINLITINFDKYIQNGGQRTAPAVVPNGGNLGIQFTLALSRFYSILYQVPVCILKLFRQ